MVERPSIQLLKGAGALVIGVGLFFTILMLIVMTPDPNQEIKYTLLVILEVFLLGVIIYGAATLHRLDKFLRLCERTTEVWQSKENSKEN